MTPRTQRRVPVGGVLHANDEHAVAIGVQAQLLPPELHDV